MKTLPIIFAMFLYSYSIIAQTCPISIRVGSNCGSGTSCSPCSTTNCCHKCTGTIDVVAFESYVKGVLPSEWYNGWGAFTGGSNALKAGAVAIRSYSIARIANLSSCHGANYDICRTTCCQVYSTPSTGSSYSNTAVDDTKCYVLTNGSGTVRLAEHANEHNNHSNCSDGKKGDGSTAWPCTDDLPCSGRTFNGHGRGMCQTGSARWATGDKLSNSTYNLSAPHGYGTKTWTQILSHYYPSWDLETCSGTACTVFPPPPNDDCADAIELNSSNNYCETNQTVENATTSYGPNQCTGCNCKSLDDNDVYYKFTATATEHTVTVSDFASNFDAVIEIRDACAGGYIECYDPTSYPDPVAYTFPNLTPGTIYYIRVFEGNNASTPPSSSTFDICVDGAPPVNVDLAVQSLRTEPATLFTCEEIDLCAIIENIGTDDASNTTKWEYSIDGDSIDVDTDPSIDAGSTADECETNYVFDNPGTYQFCVTIDNYAGETNTGNNSSCITLTVAQGPLPDEPIINNNQPVTFCPGSNVALSVSNPCGGCTYDWSNGTNNSESITVSAAGTYSVTATNACGTASNSVQVSESPNQPAPIINGPNIIHSEDTITLSIGNVCGGCTYSWNTGSTQHSIAVTTEGTYSVTATGSCGSATASHAVTVIVDAIHELSKDINLTIFPNPNTGIFTIQLETRTQEEIQISVLNILGQSVYKATPEQVVGEYSKSIELKNASAGVYFVRVKVGETYANHKIIVR